MNKLSMVSLVNQLICEIEGKVRPELEDTPNRVAKAYEEMFDGYSTDINSLFKVSKDEGKDQIVAVTGIQFVSFCEHHLLPWVGQAFVAYLPVDKVIGVSKIGRLVLAYAHRLQLQERLTKQIAHTLMDKLEPQGVAVIIFGEHSCMRYRGVKLPDSQVRTSEMLGKFREEPTLRMEVLTLLGL